MPVESIRKHEFGNLKQQIKDRLLIFNTHHIIQAHTGPKHPHTITEISENESEKVTDDSLAILRNEIDHNVKNMENGDDEDSEEGFEVTKLEVERSKLMGIADVRISGYGKAFNKHLIAHPIVHTPGAPDAEQQGHERPPFEHSTAFPLRF